MQIYHHFLNNLNIKRYYNLNIISYNFSIKFIIKFNSGN